MMNSPLNNLMLVGQFPAFPSPTLQPHNTPQAAIYSLRAIDLDEAIEEAEVACETMHSTYVRLQDEGGLSEQFIEKCAHALLRLEQINSQAYDMGAIDYSAYDLLNNVEVELFDRCAVFMEGELAQTDLELHKVLDLARAANSGHLPELKALDWKIQRLTQFWRESVQPRIGEAISALRNESQVQRLAPRG